MVRMCPGVWLGSWVDTQSRRWGGKDCRSQSESAVGNVTSELPPHSGLRVAQTDGWCGGGGKLFLDGSLG